MAHNRVEIIENTGSSLLFERTEQYEEIQLFDLPTHALYQNVPLTNMPRTEPYRNNQVDVQPYEKLLKVSTVSARLGNEQLDNTNNYEYLRQRVCM